MAKSSGLGDELYVMGYDLSGDTGSLSAIRGGPTALDVTGIKKGAPERIGGLRDGEIAWSAWWNAAADQAHEVLSPLPTSDRVVTYCHGETIGAQAACLIGKQIGYDPTRGQDGSLTIALTAVANGFGLEWGDRLTPGIRTDTDATDGASHDAGAATAHGLQAYLHVFAFDGVDATVTIQQSSDDGAGDAFAGVTSGAFTQITAPRTAERIATAGGQTVERYLRVVTTTSGGFTELSFAVVVVRNETAVTF